MFADIFASARPFIEDLVGSTLNVAGSNTGTIDAVEGFAWRTASASLCFNIDSENSALSAASTAGDGQIIEVMAM